MDWESMKTVRTLDTKGNVYCMHYVKYTDPTTKLLKEYLITGGEKNGHGQLVVWDFNTWDVLLDKKLEKDR